MLQKCLLGTWMCKGRGTQRLLREEEEVGLPLLESFSKRNQD